MYNLPLTIRHDTIEELTEAYSQVSPDLTVLPATSLLTLCVGFIAFDQKYDPATHGEHDGEYHTAPLHGSFDECASTTYTDYETWKEAVRNLSSLDNYYFAYPKKLEVGVVDVSKREHHMLPLRIFGQHCVIDDERENEVWFIDKESGSRICRVSQFSRGLHAVKLPQNQNSEV